MMEPMKQEEFNANLSKLEGLLDGLSDDGSDVSDNEVETVILQRRSIRLLEDIKSGSIISRDALEILRPCPADAISPNQISEVIEKKASKNLKKGDYLKWSDLQQ